jgi:hypothetical protein
VKSVHIIKRLKVITAFALLIFLLLSVTLVVAANPQTGYKDITCEYAFSGTRHSTNATLEYHGQQMVTLLSTDPQTVMGYISWNISWDEGASWESATKSYTFNTNRTYRTDFPDTYTAWWIDVETQVGDQIPIDGDFPVTNHLVRNMPFLVLDLISLRIGPSWYTCWWLTNENPVGVHESFYYEQWTGILVAAYSDLIQEGVLVRQMALELVSTIPVLPKEGLLAHLWLTYGALALSLTLASMAAIGAYLLIQNSRRRRIGQVSSPHP